jgi:hypothetical protein
MPESHTLKREAGTTALQPYETAPKFDKGEKFYFQIDTEQAEFVLFVGANLLEANYGPTNRAPRVTERIANGALKIAVVMRLCRVRRARRIHRHGNNNG